jgi:restriction system protein
MKRDAMKKYYRIMLGAKCVYASQCFAEGFIGVDYEILEDLTGKLPDNWKEFNKAFVPVYLQSHPGKTKIGAGLACGMLWTVSKGLSIGDIVLSPDGNGTYRVGEIVGDYFFAAGQVLPHRRKVRWLTVEIVRDAMSEALRNSTGSIGTVSDITRYMDEIESFIGGKASPAIQSVDPDITDPYAFAMEKHLEDFLVANWNQTELGREYDIYEEEGEGENVGQQYPTDSGPLDILAISKDRKRLLVVELKKGRASDVVVGQILRYMGYVKDELAETSQEVHGVIIALEDDLRMRRALSVVTNIRFFRYQVGFKLVK